MSNNNKRRRTGRLDRRLVTVIAIVLLLSAVFALYRKPSHRPVSTSEDDLEGLRMFEILDGDTGVLSSGAQVRYLGIDTPEEGEPFYLDATRANMALCIDKGIRLEYDGSEFDKYGRILAYVFVEDTIMINERLVAAGLASVYIFPDDQKNMEYRSRLILAQSDARRAERGIWSLPPPEPLEVEYLGNPKSLRFHRPGCRTLRRTDRSHLLQQHSRDYFLDDGFSPCRICKP